MEGDASYRDFDLTLTDRDLEEFLAVMEQQNTGDITSSSPHPLSHLDVFLQGGLQVQPHSNDNTSSPANSDTTGSMMAVDQRDSEVHQEGSLGKLAHQLDATSMEEMQQHRSSASSPPYALDLQGVSLDDLPDVLQLPIKQEGLVPSGLQPVTQPVPVPGASAAAATAAVPAWVATAPPAALAVTAPAAVAAHMLSSQAAATGHMPLHQAPLSAPDFQRPGTTLATAGCTTQATFPGPSLAVAANGPMGAGLGHPSSAAMPVGLAAWQPVALPPPATAGRAPPPAPPPGLQAFVMSQPLMGPLVPGMGGHLGQTTAGPGLLLQPSRLVNRPGAAAAAAAAAMEDKFGNNVSHSTVEKQRRDRLNSLIEELSDIVPATDTKYATEGCITRRPKHVVLSDTIMLLRTLQDKVKLEEAQISQLRVQAAEANAAAAAAAAAAARQAGIGSMIRCSVEGTPELPHAPEAGMNATGVVVEQGESPNCLYVKVNCRDRKGLLSDLVGALKSFPLYISTAAITTRENKVFDVFEVQLEEAGAVTAEDVQYAVQTALYNSERLKGKRQRSEATAQST